MTIEIRPYVEDDFPRIVEMRREAFRQPVRPGPWRRGGGRVLTDDGQIVATTLVDPLGQFFGGRSVPSAAISAVVADPRYRGRGLGSRLLRAVLVEQRAQGTPLAVLYPSLVGVYRRAGFEFAGAHVRYRLAVRSLPSGDCSALEPWDDEHLPEVDAGYRRAALRSSGRLDRSANWWQERLLYPPAGQPLYRYLLREDGQVTGHVVFTQQPVKSYESFAYDVQVRDLSWTTPASADALLGLLAASQPFGRDVLWSGPVDEPLLTLFGDLAPRSEWYFAWMLRLLDLPAAFAGRGYPQELATSVTFSVTDELFPENAGSWRLQVEEGGGTVERVDAAGATLDVGALASLYSGWSSARSLAALGRLSGTTEAELSRLDLIFSGPRPWISEII